LEVLPIILYIAGFISVLVPPIAPRLFAAGGSSFSPAEPNLSLNDTVGPPLGPVTIVITLQKHIGLPC
jgi:hypothetical protein